MLKSFDDIIKKAQSTARSRVLVANAVDKESLIAVDKANALGLSEAVLIGRKKGITSILAKNKIDKNKYEIIDEEDEQKIAETVSKLADPEKGDIILKGNIKTNILLKAILSKKKLNCGILSDLFVFEAPLPCGKLMALTDGGINILPSLDTKIRIIENAVSFYHALGCKSPRVALLSCTEEVNEKIQSTVDANILTRMNKEGEIRGCSLYGPLAFDNAVSREYARYKKIKSDVAGNPDILVVPNIESGNILAKSFAFYHNLNYGHIVMGATVPILINSRIDKSESRVNSIGLAKMQSLATYCTSSHNSQNSFRS